MINLCSNLFKDGHLYLESLKSFDEQSGLIKLSSFDGLETHLPIRYKMFSPFLCDIAASLPVYNGPLTIIMPDCSSVHIKHLANLLITGYTYTNDITVEGGITTAARILGFEMNNLVDVDGKTFTQEFPGSIGGLNEEDEYSEMTDDKDVKRGVDEKTFTPDLFGGTDVLNVKYEYYEMADLQELKPKVENVTFIQIETFAKADPSNPNIIASTTSEDIKSESQSTSNTSDNRELNANDIGARSNMKIPCPICSQEFALVCEFEAHMERCTGKRTFNCNLCDYSGALSKLRRHMTVHTGLKPYRCKLCDFSVGRRKTLQKHVKSVHSDSWIH